MIFDVFPNWGYFICHQAKFQLQFALNFKIMIFLNISMMLCLSCYVHHLYVILCALLFYVHHYLIIIVIIELLNQDLSHRLDMEKKGLAKRETYIFLFSCTIYNTLKVVCHFVM